MKRILISLTALMLVLSMSVAAMAESTDTTTALVDLSGDEDEKGTEDEV